MLRRHMYVLALIPPPKKAPGLRKARLKERERSFRLILVKLTNVYGGIYFLSPYTWLNSRDSRWDEQAQFVGTPRAISVGPIKTRPRTLV